MFQGVEAASIWWRGLAQPVALKVCCGGYGDIDGDGDDDGDGDNVY